MVITMERITINPQILKGKPIIKGTRIPVYLILELLAAGMNTKDILKEYPELTEGDIKAALQYASKLLSKRTSTRN